MFLNLSVAMSKSSNLHGVRLKEYPNTLTPVLLMAGCFQQESENYCGMKRNGAKPGCKPQDVCITATFHGKPSTKRFWDTVLNHPSADELDVHQNLTGFPSQQLHPQSNIFSSASLYEMNKDHSLQSLSGSSSLDSARMTYSSDKSLGGQHKYQSRKFKCHICPLECERKGHLEQHILAVHNHMKQFHCPFGCTKPFGHRSSLARHIKNVHGNLRDCSSSEQRHFLLSFDILNRIENDSNPSEQGKSTIYRCAEQQSM
jgi:hypothetical protein